MHAAVRSPLTAGIALAGASAIALTPIAPTMPALTEIQTRAVSSAEVALTAAANPIEQWAQVIQAAFANGGLLAEKWMADPAPILRQLLTNGLGYGQEIITGLQGSVTNIADFLRLDNQFGLLATLQRAATEISQGQFYNGMNTLFEAALGFIVNGAFPLLDLVQIPVRMAQNFADAVATLPSAVLGLGLGAIGNVAGVVSAFGTVGQAVVDAMSTGDLLGALNAIVGAPATLVGAVLNGFEPTGAPGILGPNGLVDQLMNAAKAIAVALGVPQGVFGPAATTADTTLAEVSSVPDSVALSAETDTVAAVTVSTTVDAAAEPEAVTEEAVTEEAVTEEPVTEEPVTEEPATEEPSATTETETTETGSGSTGEATTGNGATDLSEGNKAEPGSAGESGTPGGSGGDETEPDTTPSASTGADNSESGDSSTGSDDSDSSGASE